MVRIIASAVNGRCPAHHGKMEHMEQLPVTPLELLNAFRSNNPTAPRLTWYGPGGERVEFSGRVLENWVAKTANYLNDELDAEIGTELSLELPLHWRSLVWLLAGWAVGARVNTHDAPTPASGSRPDIIATADPERTVAEIAGTKPAPLVVAVALPALAMRWMGELPPRTLDYSGDVRSHADVFFADDEPAAEDIAWSHGGRATSYGELLAGAPGEAPRRQLLQTTQGWAAVVPAALAAWAAGGSVVLLGEGVAASDHLRETENVTAG